MEYSVSQNFHPECEFSISKIINLELHASYVYFTMTYYFCHHNMALKHFSMFFREQSEKKKEHAEKIIQYLIKRGGHPVLENILKSEVEDWSNSLQALEEALVIEKAVNEDLLALYDKAKEHEDPHLCGFLKSELLDEQVKIIKLLGDYITNLKRLGMPENRSGEYIFDKYTLGENCQISP
ncbi:ferritin heavy chain B-like [Gracilinanus agilis]|uniref:ferritin heavy chain B-like n=1 Tax=Gracilinanus agilis TaxID=191870 RepID=UPI001CFC997C|nr:ferritin heavy chain B-like [Gracilinanus agilis]